MNISTIGSVRFKIYGVLLLVNTVVLALSGHINHFQEFFYKADVFPLALSLATAIFVLTMIFVDIGVENAFTARPPFELVWLFVSGTLWLGFNAFSTNRWRHVSFGLCGTIPSDAQYAPYHTWCHELQALRVFIWIEWVMLLCTFAFLLRWTVSKHSSGRKDVWSTAFSRFSEYPQTQSRYRGGTNSEFLQWEKFPSALPQSSQQDSMQTQYNQSPHASYTQYPQAEYTQSQDTYSQPAQTQYTQHPHAQYIPPSQAQLHDSSQEYYNGSPQAF